MATVFKAGDYSTRSELENAVRNKISLTPDPKDSTVEGTREELFRLQLSGRCLYWGMQVIEKDPEDPKPVTKKPDRGVVFESGINLSEEKKGKAKKNK